MESAKTEWKVYFLFGFNFLLTTSIFLCTGFGCQKDELEPAFPANVAGEVLHHNNQIQSGIVFLKLNAVEFPGNAPSSYDDSIRFHSPPSEFHFENITSGNYYLYCKGYDYYFQDSVFGGIPVHVKSGETKHVIVAVTE